MENEKAARVLRTLSTDVEFYTRWMDKASALEERGQKDTGFKTWRQMAEGKAVEIVELLDQAERDGISLPEVPSLASIPTRYKLREEIDRLKAEVASAERRAEDMKTLKSSAVFMRLQAETSLRRWKAASVALGIIAIVGWFV